VLRRISETKREVVVAAGENDMAMSFIIFALRQVLLGRLRGMKMRWAEYLARTNVYKSLIGNPQGGRQVTHLSADGSIISI
jgi:hypothetical protein